MRWPADLDPARLRQPDARSCGAASMLAARALVDGWRPSTADQPADEIKRAHRALTSWRDLAGHLQVPWPRALGTPPWAVARQLRELTGAAVRTHVVRLHPTRTYDELTARLATGRPVAVYIGSRWLPRHVVLAVDATDLGIEVFDPAHGRVVTVPRERWAGHRVGVAGWSHAWAVV